MTNISPDVIQQQFSIENFSQKLLMQYFFLKHKEPGAAEYLAAKLHYLNDHKFEFFLPQIWFLISFYRSYLYVKWQKPMMAQLLQKRGSKNLKHFFSIRSLVNAYSELERKDKQLAEKINFFQSQLETDLVNSSVDQRELEQASLSMTPHDFQQQVQVMLFLEKESKSDYIVKCQKFIHGLIKISITLKKEPIEERKALLDKHIHSGNKLLKKIRTERVDVPFYHGVILPFPKYKGDQYESTLIVNIIERDHTCFNTKQRVPYRIIVETIEYHYKELQQLRPSDDCYSAGQSTSTLDPEDNVYEEARFDETERKMKEIAQDKILFDYDITALKNLKKKDGDLFVQTQSFRKSNTLGIGSQEVPSIFDRLKNNKVQQRRASSSENNLDASEEKLQQIQDKFPSPYQFMDEKEIPDSFGPWEEIWEDKEQIIKRQSRYGHFKSYKIRQIIIKGGDDLRQELLAMQLIRQMQKIFKRENCNLYLRPYDIIITSTNSGIIEYIPNTLSIDALKKKVPGYTNLHDFYHNTFKKDFDHALKNFLQSLAGYSLVQYFLQIKDRHNGNILIDNIGNIIHIDFGFMFCLSPGNVNFETAPFKLTSEYLDLMKSPGNDMLTYFESLLISGFLALRKHLPELISLIEMMLERQGSDLYCFKGFNLNDFRARFMEKASYQEIFVFVNQLVEQSQNNHRTVKYDWFQYWTNGIAQ